MRIAPANDKHISTTHYHNIHNTRPAVSRPAHGLPRVVLRRRCDMNVLSATPPIDPRVAASSAHERERTNSASVMVGRCATEHCDVLLLSNRRPPTPRSTATALHTFSLYIGLRLRHRLRHHHDTPMESEFFKDLLRILPDQRRHLVAG